MQVDVVDVKNSKVGDVELAPDIFEGKIRPHLLRDMVISQLANRRRGTHKVKSRSEVSGGGKKPWKQKGLGRARAGSIRSPIFRGGGIVFGPQPRDYGYTLPKKARRAALISALSLKVKENSLKVLDKLELADHKTKNAAAVLKALGATGKALVVVAEKEKNAELGFRNLPGVKLVRPETVNVYDLMNVDHVVLSQDALTKIQERLAK